MACLYCERKTYTEFIWEDLFVHTRKFKGEQAEFIGRFLGLQEPLVFLSPAYPLPLGCYSLTLEDRGEGVSLVRLLLTSGRFHLVLTLRYKETGTVAFADSLRPCGFFFHPCA